MDRYLQESLSRNIEKWVPKEQRYRDIFFQRLSDNPCLDSYTLKKYPKEHWNLKKLVNNRSFNTEWVDIIGPDASWNWGDISKKGPTIDFVKKHRFKPFDWLALSLGDNISFEDMLNNSDFPWVIEDVLFQSIEKESDIAFLRHFENRYDYHAWVDHSSRVEWELLKKYYSDLPWIYYHVNPVVCTQDDLDFIRAHETHAWNWSDLSTNVDIHLIMANKDLPWVWYTVSSQNLTLTYDVVESNPDVHWEYAMVPCERFSFQLARKWTAANTIKSAFRRAISDPGYLMCRKRLEREFKILTCV